MKKIFTLLIFLLIFSSTRLLCTFDTLVEDLENAMEQQDIDALTKIVDTEDFKNYVKIYAGPESTQTQKDTLANFIKEIPVTAPTYTASAPLVELLLKHGIQPNPNAQNHALCNLYKKMVGIPQNSLKKDAIMADLMSIAQMLRNAGDRCSARMWDKSLMRQLGIESLYNELQKIEGQILGIASRGDAEELEKFIVTPEFKKYVHFYGDGYSAFFVNLINTSSASNNIAPIVKLLLENGLKTEDFSKNEINLSPVCAVYKKLRALPVDGSAQNQFNDLAEVANLLKSHGDSCELNDFRDIKKAVTKTQKSR